MGYPSGHYMPPNAPYYPAETTPHRERYAADWNRDRDYLDYRRDYERRPPPPPSGNS